MAVKPSHDTLIHCEACGEDYSATYRRCPFCGARNDPRRTSPRNDPKSSSRYIPTPPPAQERGSREEDLDDTYVFDGQDVFEEEPEEYYDAPRPKGGKRLAPKEGGSFELPPINWPRLITFLCSLVIIVAALIIVFTYIYPQLHKDPNPDASAGVSAIPSTDPSPAYSDPLPTYSQDVAPPTESETPPVEPSAGQPSTPPAGTAATIVNASGGLNVRPDPSTSNPPIASLLNGNTVTVLADAGGGWYQISLAGRNGATITGYVKGDYLSTVAGTSDPPAGATNPPATTTQTPSNTSGGPTVGRPGTIVNAAGGLNVRPDPSTSNPAIASLLNGNTVTVVANAGNGWYQISFIGRGGTTMTGYIMGEYISTN